jgi:hypothetical protein
MEENRKGEGTVCVHMRFPLRSDFNLLIDPLCILGGIIRTHFERRDELHNSVHVDVEPISETLHIRYTVEACASTRKQGKNATTGNFRTNPGRCELC